MIPPSSPNPDPYLFPLPQYGFGPDIQFKTLLPNNPFLYRVYTPKERSPFFDDTDPFFVAPKFDEVYARTPVEITSASIIDPLDASYADVAAHMEWTTRSKSPFLTTSFSFAWSIWEAVRRYHQGMKKDVEIAIIDASAVMGRAATGVQLLRKSSAEERDQQYSKWYRFAQESQSVLIHGLVPGTAVLASIPLLTILERLPPYYLRSKTQASPSKPLDHLGWNYTDKKHNYRQFCQEITNRFFAQSQEIRFRDATGGSMRLALTLLRPWFHRMVTQDFKHATSYLRALAIMIAHWGGQWWAKEHSELNRILDAMANTLGEELVQRFKMEEKDQQQIYRLQDTVDTLEKVIRTHETRRLFSKSTRAGTKASKGECCSTPITPESSPKVRPRRTLSMSIPIPSRHSANVQTPITPPESPSYSQIFSRNVDLEYLPSTIAFQPFTPPLEWPSILPTATPSGSGGGMRSRSLSVSTQSSRTSGPSTPPALRSILSPVAEVVSPVEDQSHVAPQESTTPMTETNLRQLPEQHAAAAPLIPALPQTPKAPLRRQYLPSPATTPPVILDSLMRDGFRARTLSDVSVSGLRIEIPNVAVMPRQLVFDQQQLPPSPTDTVRTRVSESESPRSLAPPSPPSPAAVDLEKSGATLVGVEGSIVGKTSLGSPIAFGVVRELEPVEDWSKLPPLPPSPSPLHFHSRSSTLSWGSVSTLPPSRAPSPQQMKAGDAPLSPAQLHESPTFVAEDDHPTSKSPKPTRPTLSALSSLRLGSTNWNPSSIEDDFVSPLTLAALEKPLPLSRTSSSASLSSTTSSDTSLSEYLVTPVMGKPQRGEDVRYRVPRAPVNMLRSPSGASSSSGAVGGLGLGLGYYRRADARAGSRRGARRGQEVLAETGAFIVTGFLLGAAVTLFLISTQRRTLLSLT